ncbi:MAG: MFS transporter, partial [Pyrinomonadaceae bacterium]
MSKSNRNLFFSLYWLFFLVGISTVLVGQVLPILARRFSISDSESGYFFIAHFAGSLSGIFLYNYQAQKSNFIRTILLGICASATGILLLNADSQVICTIGFFLNGICAGANIPAVNMLVAKLSSLRVSSSLQVLNFFWGVGAISSQPFFHALSSDGSVLLPTVLLAGAYLIAFVFIYSHRLEEKTEESSRVNRA